MLWMSVCLDFHADWAYCWPDKSLLIDAPFKGLSQAGRTFWLNSPSGATTVLSRLAPARYLLLGVAFLLGLTVFPQQSFAQG
jgi:hypothetical protein